MITTILMIPALALAINCPKLKFVNKTTEWTQNDEKMLKITAPKLCRQRYGEKSGCISFFRKSAFQSYAFLCADEGSAPTINLPDNSGFVETLPLIKD